MTREEAINLIGWLKSKTNRDDDLEAIDMAIEALRHDVIFEQIKWERDVALETLEEHGIGFGQKAQGDISDLISRADAIKAFPKITLADMGFATKAEYKAEAIENIKTLPSVETIQDDWIPISEGLPEEHEWVGTKPFGTTISDKVHITFDVNGERFVRTLSLQNGELSKHDKRTMDTLYKGWKMIAWMPLPKPYREDGEA